MQKEVPVWLIDLIQSIYINYSDNARVRAGHLGVVKKYVRRDYLFIVLKRIEDTGIDMTPTLAKQILELWTGQGADWKALLKVFRSTWSNRRKEI